MTLGPTVGGVNLTRRGWLTLCVALVALVLAGAFGGRALNALVLPAFVALGAAVVMVRRVERPRVEREVPPDGFPDETATVTLSFRTDNPFTGRVADALSPGLDGETSVETTVGVDPISYDVRYLRRGEHDLGPVELVARDVLGLAERSFVTGRVDHVLVYPRLTELSGRAKRDLLSVYDPRWETDRDEFDRLREYQRGDSLRDVHWKSSAKRDDLVVKEFTYNADERAVSVAATAATGGADRLAEAAGSVCSVFLDAGVAVTLSTPDGSVAADPSDRRVLLEHLARVGDGAAADEEADVVLRATGDSVRVGFAGTDREFVELAADRASGRGRRGSTNATSPRAALADGGASVPPSRDGGGRQ